MTALGDRYRAQGQHLSTTLLVAALQDDAEGVTTLTGMVVADEPARCALANLAGIAAHLIRERAQMQGTTPDYLVAQWQADLLAAQAT